MDNNLLQDEMLRLDLLRHFSEKPAPFAPGAERFWDDPYISRQLLAAHLDPTHDAASRRPEIIDRSVDWLMGYLQLGAGDRLLDLGCGPGLYCERFARRGLVVTGIDYSHGSIEYAIGHAEANGLTIDYRYGNYIEAPYPQDLATVLMIYGDLCVLPPEQRDTVLRRIREVLKPGGSFVFDVSTRAHRQRFGARNHWEVVEAGFWRPIPHLVLTQGFDYPEGDLYVDQFVVVTTDGEMTVYRNWFQDYSLETITAVLAESGFAVRAAWSDLTGAPYKAGSEWIGVAATPR